jgi:nucleoside-diphosphate-sugar epimerase
MMGKRILVTGGAGFLGSHLCDRLLGSGAEVICLDNFFTGAKRNVEHLLSNPRFEIVRHDLVLPILIEVDQIYNFACPASPVHYQYNPVKTIKTSVMGTINMLGLAKRARARILQASTSEVYGDPRESGRPSQLLRRGQARGGNADDGLPPPERRGHPDRAHLQYVWPAHGGRGRPRGEQFHRAGSPQSTDHDLW